MTTNNGCERPEHSNITCECKHYSCTNMSLLQYNTSGRNIIYRIAGKFGGQNVWRIKRLAEKSLANEWISHRVINGNY